MDVDSVTPSTPLQQVCDALECLTQGSARLRSAVHTTSTATFRRGWTSSLDPDAQQMFGYLNECNLHDWSTRTSNVQVRLALAELTLQQALEANAGNPKAASVLPRYQDLVLAAQTDLDLRADLLQLIQELSLPDVSLGDTNSVALRVRRALVARNRRALALKHRADELTAALAAVEAAVVAESTSDALACRTYIARYLSEDAFRSSPAPSSDDGTSVPQTGTGPSGSVSPTHPALISGLPGPAAGHSPVIADGRSPEGPSASLWSPHDLYTSALLPTATDVLPLGAGTAGAGVQIQLSSRAGSFSTGGLSAGADPTALSLEHSSLPRLTDLACLLNGPLTTKGTKGHAGGLQEDSSGGTEMADKAGTGGVGEYILVDVPLTVSLAKALSSASEHLQARRMAERNAALESATLAAGLGSSSAGLLPSAESSVQIERATVPAHRLRSSLAFEGSKHEKTQDEDMAGVDSGSHGSIGHGVSRVLSQIRKAAQGEFETTAPMSANAQAQGQGQEMGKGENQENRSVSIAATEEVAAIEMSHGFPYVHTGRRPGEVVQVQQEFKEDEAESATSDPYSAPAMARLKARGCDLPRKAFFNNRAALLPTSRIVGLRVTALQVNTAAAEEGWLRPQDVLLGVSLHGTDRRWGVSVDNLHDGVLPVSAGQEKSALALDGWQNGKLAALLKSSLLASRAGTGTDGQRGILGSICLARPAPLVLLEASVRGKTAAEVLQRPWPVEEGHGLPAFVLSPPTDVKPAPVTISASKAADPLGTVAPGPPMPSLQSPKRGRPPSSSFSGTYGPGTSSLASPQAPAAGVAGTGVGRARASSAAAVLGVPVPSSTTEATNGTAFDSIDSVRGASAPPAGVPTRLILEPLSVDREHPALDRALCLTTADATSGFGMGVEDGSFTRAVRADAVYTGYRPSGVERIDQSLSDWNVRRQGRGDGKAGGGEAGGAAGKAGRKAAAAAAAVAAAAAAQSASAETVDSERKAARSNAKAERSGSASSSGPGSSARGAAAALLGAGGSAQDVLMTDDFYPYTADTAAGKVSKKTKKAAKSKSGKPSSEGGGGAAPRARAVSSASAGSDMTVEDNDTAAGGGGTGQQGASMDDAAQSATGVVVRSKRKSSHKASLDLGQQGAGMGAGIGDDILIVNDTAVGASVDAGAGQSDAPTRGATGKKAGGKRKRVDSVAASTDAEPSASASSPAANAETAGTEVGMGAGESAAGDTVDAAASNAAAAKRGRKAAKASKSSSKHAGASDIADTAAQSQGAAAHSTSRSPSGRVIHDNDDGAAHSGSAVRGQGSGSRAGSGGKGDSAGRAGGKGGSPGGQEAAEDMPVGPSVPPIVPANPRIQMYRGHAPILPSGHKDAIRAKRVAARAALQAAASGGAAAANISNTSTVAAGQSMTGSQPSTARSASSAGSSAKSSEAAPGSTNVMFPELGKLQPIAPITRDIMLAALRGEWRKHHTHATVTPCDRQLHFPSEESGKLNIPVPTPRNVGEKRLQKQGHGQPADAAVRGLGETTAVGREDGERIDSRAETVPELLSSPQQVRAGAGGEGMQGDSTTALGGVPVEYTPLRATGSAAEEAPLSAATGTTVPEGADASAASSGRRPGSGRGGSSVATKKAGSALAPNVGRSGTGAAPSSSGSAGAADEAEEEYAWLDDEDSDDESVDTSNTVEETGSAADAHAAAEASAEGAGPHPASRSAARGAVDSAPGAAATKELPPLTCDLFRHMHQPFTFHLNFKNVGAVPLRRILAAAGMPYDGDKLCLMERMRALLAAPVSPDVRPLPPLDFNKEASQGTPQKNAPRAWDWAVDTARKLGFGDTDTRVRHWLTCPLSPSDPPLHPVVASYRSYVSLPKDKQVALQSNGKGWVFSLPPPVTACEPYLLCRFYAYPDMVLAAPFLRTVNAFGHDLLLAMGFHAKNGAKLQQEHEMHVQSRASMLEEVFSKPGGVDGGVGADPAAHASSAAGAGASAVGGGGGSTGGPATDSSGIASASAIGRRRASQRSPPSGGVSFGPPSARSATSTSPPSAKGGAQMSRTPASAAAGGSSTVEEAERGTGISTAVAAPTTSATSPPTAPAPAADDAGEQTAGTASVPTEPTAVSSASAVAATTGKSGRGRKRPLSSDPSPSSAVLQSGAPTTRLAAVLAGPSATSTAKDDADIEIVDEESSGKDASVARTSAPPGDHPSMPPAAPAAAESAQEEEGGEQEDGASQPANPSAQPSSTNKKARVQDAKNSAKGSVGLAVPSTSVHSLSAPSATTATAPPSPAGLPISLPGLQIPIPDLGPLEGAAEIQLGEIGALGLDLPGAGLDLGLASSNVGSDGQGQGRPPLLAAVAEAVGIEVVDISGLPSSHVHGGVGPLLHEAPSGPSGQGTASQGQGGNKGKGGVKGKGGRWVKTGGGGGGGGTRSTPVGAFPGFATGPASASSTTAGTTAAAASGAWNGKGKAGSSSSRTGTASGKGKGGPAAPYTTRGASSSILPPLPIGSPALGLGSAGGAGASVAPALALTLPMAPLDRPHGVRHALGVYSSLGIDDGVKVRYTPYARTAVDTLPCGWDDVECWKEVEKEDRITKRLRVYDWAAESITAQAAGAFPAAVLAAWPAASPLPAGSPPAGTPVVTVRPLIPPSSAPLPSPSPASSPAVDMYARPVSRSAASGSAFPSVVSPVCAVDVLCSILACVTAAQIDGETYVVAGQGADPVALMGRALLDIRMAHSSILEPMYVSPLYCLALGTAPGAGLLGDRPSQRALGKSSLFDDAAGGSSFLQPRSLPTESDHDDCLISIGSEPGLPPELVLRRIVSAAAAEIRRFAPQSDYGAIKLQRIALMASAALRTSMPGVSSCFLSPTACALSQVTYGTFAPSEPKRGPVFTAAGPLLQHGHGTRGSKHGFYGPSAAALIAGSVSSGPGGGVAGGGSGLTSERGDRAIETRGGGFAPEHRTNMPAALPRDAPMVPLVGVESADCVHNVAPGTSARQGEFTTEVDPYAARALTAMLHAVGATMISITARPGAAVSGLFGSSSRAGASGPRVRAPGEGSSSALGLGGTAMGTASSLGSSSTALVLSTGPSSPVPGVVPTLVVQTLTQRCSYDVWGRLAARSKIVQTYLSAGTPFVRERADADNSEGMTELEAAIAEASLGESDGHRLVGAVELVRRMQVQAVYMPRLPLRPRAGHKQSSGSGQTSMHAAYSFLGKLYRPVPPSQGELLLRSWASTLSNLQASQAQASAAAAVHQKYQRARNSLRRVQEAVAAESCRRRLCALIVECTARGLYSVAAVLSGWIPAGMLPHDKPAVVEPGQMHAEVGDAPTTWVPVSSWPWPYPVVPCAGDGGDGDTNRDAPRALLHRVDTAAAEAAFYGHVDTPAGRREKQLLESLGFLDPVSACASVDPLPHVPGSESTPMETATQPPGAWFVGQTPNVPLTAQTQDPASRTAAHSLFLSLQRYAVEGRFVTPLGQRLLHPLAVLNFVTLQAQM